MGLEHKISNNIGEQIKYGLLGRIKNSLVGKIATYSLATALTLGGFGLGCNDNNNDNPEINTVYYKDSDGDGFTVNTDCNDGDNTIYPNAPELCDGIDNNCDGTVDEGVKNTYYRDRDRDGFGDPLYTMQACSTPSYFVGNDRDCNDNNNTVYPNAHEMCDWIDNNCDGIVDEGCPLKVVWSTIYDGGYDDEGRGIALDSSGNVYVTGYSSNGIDWDIKTIKYDNGGNIIRSNVYNSGYHDYGTGVALDSSGNVYVAGSSSNGIDWDIRTIKYDKDLGEIWNKVYDGGNYDNGEGLTVDSSDNIYVVGSTWKANWDCIVIRYDTSGLALWSKTYDSLSDEQCNSIAMDSSENIYIIGYSWIPSRRDEDIRIVKYNRDMNMILWDVLYDGGRYDYGADIIVDSFGFVYAVGSLARAAHGQDLDYVTLKYDKFGNMVWKEIFDSGGSDTGHGITIDSLSNVYITGESSGGKSYDIRNNKYGKDGNILWSLTHGGEWWDVGYDIAVDSLGNVYVTGSWPNGKDNDLVIIKYKQNY